MPPHAGYYPTDDMPEYIKKILQMNEKLKRKSRSDLKPGMIVVVLKGEDYDIKDVKECSMEICNNSEGIKRKIYVNWREKLKLIFLKKLPRLSI